MILAIAGNHDYAPVTAQTFKMKQHFKVRTLSRIGVARSLAILSTQAFHSPAKVWVSAPAEAKKRPWRCSKADPDNVRVEQLEQDILNCYYVCT
jgi:hypothetical protein